MLKVKLPDKTVIEVKKGQSVLEVAKIINLGLAKAAIAAEIDNVLVDLTREIHEDCSLKILTKRSDEGLNILNHSAAHVMAAAVMKLFPDVKLLINEHNVGFAKTVNKGIAAASNDLICLLNNDIALPNPGWLKKMVESVDEYDLTGPEKLAFITGDIAWIEDQIGPLTEKQKRWLEHRLEAEIW